MLTKTKFIYITLLLTLLICLFLDILLEDKISYLFCAYFIVFVVLSLFLIFRGLIYKIDTNLYFGVLLLISPLIQTIIYLDYIKYYLILATIFLMLTLASLLVWLFFKDKTHKKLFFVFLGEIIVCLLPICLTKISFWALIILAVVWFIFYFAVNYFKKKKG